MGHVYGIYWSPLRRIAEYMSHSHGGDSNPLPPDVLFTYLIA